MGVDPIQVPAKTIPAPRSISPEAQASLVQWDFGGLDLPALEDVEAWRALVAISDQAMLTMLEERAAGIVADVQPREVGGVPVFDITPAHCSPGSEHRVQLDIHGGALLMGGGDCCRAMGLMAAARAGVRTVCVDYRMPPDHPYPAALDDCLTVYRALLEDHRPQDIVVEGASAGGNLAAALILRGRDEGLPLPAAAVLLTPEVDLTESGDSFQTNLGVDTVLTQSLAVMSALYAAGHDLEHPYLSPLFGDFTKGFPPTFLQTGTRDLFLSNTVRMHRALRAAGIEAELHVFEAMPHGGFSGAPEDAEASAEARRFIDAHWR
jgi:acetyl esterase/lipase